MTATPIPITALTTGGAIAAPTGVAIDQPNGMSLGSAISSRPERTVVIVSNTTGAAHTVTIATGDPVLGAGQQRGITYSVPAGATEWIGPFDSSLSMQSDGTMRFGFDTGFTGTIAAVTLPRTA